MRTFDGYEKGVDLGGWISQCVSYDKAHFDNFITEKDIQLIASWGLDHVRVVIIRICCSAASVKLPLQSCRLAFIVFN